MATRMAIVPFIYVSQFPMRGIVVYVKSELHAMAMGIKGHLNDSLFLTRTVIVSFLCPTLSSQTRTPLRTGKPYYTHNTSLTLLQFSPTSLSFFIVSRTLWQIGEEEGAGAVDLSMVLAQDAAVEEERIVAEVEEAGVAKGVPWAL